MNEKFLQSLPGGSSVALSVRISLSSAGHSHRAAQLQGKDFFNSASKKKVSTDVEKRGEAQ